MTQWHRDWQSQFEPEQQEHWHKGHRADVLWMRRVLEFQHSKITPEIIREREQFWGRLYWVFDARDWFDNLDIRPNRNKTTFRWKHPRWSIYEANCPKYLDNGSELFQITFMGSDTPCGGTGQFIPYNQFRCAILHTV